ncbi:hypothetical protein M758_10G168300 [Ceratodon purpureus]|nr:hypothetical protein M758_10G168300 [Ceratodon purpureus]
MLSSRCQPVQRGSLVNLPSSSSLSSWPINSANQPRQNVPVIVCVGISQANVGVSDGRERRRSVKDVWRPKRNGEHLQKCSEAAESTSYVSEAIHKDRLRQQLTYLSTCNGLSLANVDDTTGLSNTSKDLEKSFTKKPSHRVKDVWVAGKRHGSRSNETGATGGKVDVWMAEKLISPANHVSPPPSSSLGSMSLTEEKLVHELVVPASPHTCTEPTMNRKRISSGRDVWRERSNEDGLTTNLKSLGHSSKNRDSRKRLYLVDIHALCYDGNKVQPRKVVEWLKLLFTEVTQDNPIIAVMDGERGNEYRRKLLPSYKAKRNYYKPLAAGNGYSSPANDLRKALPLIHGFLTLCHIPVVKLEFAEADDVIASLASQARYEGFQVVIASPDMDFKQLLSPDIHMLLPLPELGRWSFYTLQNYVLQNTVTPDLELGLKCMLGDVSDNVIGLSDVAPGFGRKTALKLMQKHGSLEKLLTAAATRTVGRDYIQDALTKHADLLRRNLQESI